MVAVKQDTPHPVQTICVAPSHALEKTCEICFISDKSRRLRCGHMLCRGCDQEWRSRGNHTCPFCRASLSPNGKEDTDVVVELRLGLPARLARAQSRAQSVLDARRMSPIEVLLAQQGELDVGGNDISDNDEEECDLTETVNLSNAVRVGESPASGKVDGSPTLKDGDIELKECGVTSKVAGSAKLCSDVYIEIGTDSNESDPVPPSEQAALSVRKQRTVRMLLQELRLDSALSSSESHDVLNGAGAELGIPSQQVSADSSSDNVYDEPMWGDSGDILAVSEDPPGPLRSAWADITMSTADYV